MLSSFIDPKTNRQAVKVLSSSCNQTNVNPLTPEVSFFFFIVGVFIPSRFPFQPELQNGLNSWHLSVLHPVPLVCLCKCQEMLTALVGRKKHVLNSMKSLLLAQHSGTNQELLAQIRSSILVSGFNIKF